MATYRIENSRSPRDISGTRFILVFALGTLPCTALAAPIMTDQEVNMTNKSEALVALAGTLAERVGCPLGTFSYTGQVTPVNWSARATGTYAASALNATVSGTFNGASHRGTMSFSGTYGPDTIRGDGEVSFNPSRDIALLSADGSVGAFIPFWDVHWIKDWYIDRFGRIRDQGYVVYTINGIPIAKYWQKSLIFRIPPFRYFFVKQRVAGESSTLCVIEVTGQRVGATGVAGKVSLRPSL